MSRRGRGGADGRASRAGAPRIAIDGPSGSGKSTLGELLARRLGLAYVDTGAMYRAVAWKALQEGVEAGPEPSPAVEERMARLLADTDLRVDADPDAFAVHVDGREVTEEIRAPEVGRMASFVAALDPVRAWLVPRQRALAAGGVVMEGRDIGTVVLPDADCKFFVTSDAATRVGRRAAQLGPDRTEEANEDVRARDERDRSRRASPLRAASEAITVDTTDATVEESLDELLEAVREATGKG